MKNINLFLITAILTFTTIYSQNIKSPSEFLGYELGTQFSRHNQVVDYFKYVSSKFSTKVVLEKYGETNERRPLYITYISSENNIKNLEKIRNNNLNNAGMDGIKDDNYDSTAIVWLSYNVHGNESSSTEAAMKTLYMLVTENISDTAFDAPFIFGIGADFKITDNSYIFIGYNQLFAAFLDNQGNFSTDITLGYKLSL